MAAFKEDVNINKAAISTDRSEILGAKSEDFDLITATS
jgi:hypothetical protein